MPSAAALLRRLGGGAQEIARRALQGIEHVAIWAARVRERRQLHRLSDHMLKDIGVSRSDAEREISKPFWRL